VCGLSSVRFLNSFRVFFNPTYSPIVVTDQILGTTRAPIHLCHPTQDTTTFTGPARGSSRRSHARWSHPRLNQVAYPRICDKEEGTYDPSGPYQNLWLTRKYGAAQATGHLLLILAFPYDGTSTTTFIPWFHRQPIIHKSILFECSRYE